MLTINDVPYAYTVFRANPDGGRTRVGTYETEEAARAAIIRSLERWRHDLDDTEADEAVAAPDHSIWRASAFERVEV